MSKKKNKLCIGRFYQLFNGPAHPSKIYFYDKKHKTYLSIKFGTTKGKHMSRIQSLEKGKTNEQYVLNRPIEGVRSDYGDKQLKGLEINEMDFELVERIKLKKPQKTRKASLRYKKMPSNH